MWFVINWFGVIEPGTSNEVWLYIVAGLVFSLINSIVRPLVTILSLPFIIISVGIFTILINTSMMALTFYFLPGISIDFWGSLFGTILISIFNWLISLIVPIGIEIENKA